VSDKSKPLLSRNIIMASYPDAEIVVRLHMIVH
jgi:hypothetical protein